MERLSSDPIAAAVRRARRRLAAQEAFAQGLGAASLGLAGAILILLAGTQLLDWRWLVLLVGVGLLVGAWRLRRRVPAPYRVAQLVDDRLRLKDTLSTAWFFYESPNPRLPEEVVRCQRSMAERLTAGLDLKAALPFRLPRTAFLFAGLLAGAGSLFALRYGMEERLDLRAPLLEVVFDAFGGRYSARPAAPPPGKKAPLATDAETPEGITVDSERFEDEKQLDAAPDKVLDTIDIPEVNNDRLGTEQGQAKGEGAGPDRTGEAEGEPGENASESDAPSAQTAETDSGKSGKRGDEDSGGKQAPNSAGDDSSLAQKFRDALNNLMSKMRPQSASQGQNAKSPSKSGGQQSTQQSASANQGEGQKAEGQQAGQKGEGQEGEPGESEEGQSAEGASKGRSTESASSQTPGSGMGKQDGAKDARLAEQLEAMGKLSEILGKRSQNVTGETTIEVQSSKAGIRTPYSQSAAAHGQAGGEIHRDEVPEALQHYVQQYFEQVRRPQQK